MGWMIFEKSKDNNDLVYKNIFSLVKLASN